MSEQLNQSFQEEPTPEQVATTRKVINQLREMIMGYHNTGLAENDPRRMTEDAWNHFPNRFHRHFATEIRGGEVNPAGEYRMHISWGGSNARLSVESQEGKTELDLYEGGKAEMIIIDSDGNRTGTGYVPITDGQLEFADTVIDVLQSRPLEES